MSGVKLFVEGMISGLIFDELRITEATFVTPRFRQMRLAGPALRDRSCAPGDKLQIMVPGTGSRTYTPFSFDKTAGTLEILAYVHGDRPGAAWAAAAPLGATLRALGPRRSLPLASLEGPIVFVGDETSLAASKTLVDHRARTNGPGIKDHFVFETTDSAEVNAVLEALLPAAARENTVLVPRQAADEHIPALEAAVRAALALHPASTLVLTGRAQAIQQLRTALKTRAPSTRVTQKVRAYWSLGKTGLD